MKCSSCKSENISKLSKKGMGKIFSVFRLSATCRCLDCGMTFRRFNRSFIVMLIVVGAGAAGAWVLFENMPLTRKTAPSLTQSISKPIKIPKSETIPIKISLPEAKKEPSKGMVQDTSHPSLEGKTDLSQQKTKIEVNKPEPISSSEVKVKAEKKKIPGMASDDNAIKKAEPSTVAVAPGLTREKNTKITPETGNLKKEVKKETEIAKTNLAIKKTLPTKKPEQQPDADVSVQKKELLESQTPDLKKLKGIKLQVLNGENQIVILADNTVIEYKYFFLNKPSRMVIDLLGNWEQPKFLTKSIKNDLINKIRLWKHKDKLRIVSDFKEDRSVFPIFKESSEGLVVILK